MKEFRGAKCRDGIKGDGGKACRTSPPARRKASPSAGDMAGPGACRSVAPAGLARPFPGLAKPAMGAESPHSRRPHRSFAPCLPWQNWAGGTPAGSKRCLDLVMLGVSSSQDRLTFLSNTLFAFRPPYPGFSRDKTLCRRKTACRLAGEPSSPCCRCKKEP